MLRFPLGFSADLTKVLIAQKLFGADKFPAVLRLNPIEWAARGAVDATSSVLPAMQASLGTFGDSVDPIDSALNSDANTQMLAFIGASKAPAVWIGGDTPLQYPHIGQLTRDIVKLGQTIFVEKDGRLLRRRIHEFRPVSQLYVTVELNGTEASHDLRARHAGLFRSTMEGIRAAKLSGFLICVQTKIFADTQLGELGSLAEQIIKMDVDGWVLTRAAASEFLPDHDLEAARNLIPNRRWKWFSELLDQSAVRAIAPLGEQNQKTSIEAREGEESAEGLRVR
jgi:hypothetical protein